MRCILKSCNIECLKEAQELHFFTTEIHGKKLVRNINLPARFRGAQLFMGQFRTIYILRAGFVKVKVKGLFIVEIALS